MSTLKCKADFSELELYFYIFKLFFTQVVIDTLILDIN